MAKAYRIRPSQILGMQNDDYSAFCLDEACAVLLSRHNLGERCYFIDDCTESKDKADNLITFLKEFETVK